MSNQKTIIKPQQGFQSKALTLDADIAIMGGAAGCSKTYTLLLWALKHMLLHNNYEGIFLRRRNKDLFGAGGAWNEAIKLYAIFKPKVNRSNQYIQFSNGATLHFGACPTEKDVYNYQGYQFSQILMDEATHFTEFQFWYFYGRLRSKANFLPDIRLTCNPEPGWVKNMIKWYLLPSQYPDNKKAGKKIWIARDKRTGEILQFYKKKNISINQDEISSFTFLPGLLEDNPLMLKSNPRYKANLSMLPKAKRLALEKGCWAFDPEMSIFARDWFKWYDFKPLNLDKIFITIDTASARGGKSDYSCMCIWGLKQHANEEYNKLYLLDMLHGRYTYEGLLANIIKKITTETWRERLLGATIYIEAADVGRALISTLNQHLNGVKIQNVNRSKKKITRAYHIQFYVEKKYVYLPYNTEIGQKALDEFITFNADDTHEHDDITDNMVDACEIAISLSKNKKVDFKPYVNYIY